MRRAVATLALLLALLFVAGCGGDSGDGASPTSAPTTAAGPVTTVAPVVRQILAADVDPPGAPGRTLSLARYTIAPGAQLPAHIHPGVQLASIESGSLTYTVLTGTAVVTRAGGAQEPVTGPSTVTLGPGDAVSEKGDMVHFGANTTASPVVILATLLTETGLDLAVVVTTTTTAPPG